MIQLSVQRVIGLCALVAASLLSACGGASSTVNPLQPTRIVAFGDGFSDVGNSANANGGLRYTVRGDATANTLTTPTTVVEVLANIYGLWGGDGATNAAVAMRIGQTGTFPSTGLVSYAMGNAMISPATGANSGGLGGSESTLTAQVDDFLVRVNGQVGTSDLIIITAGTRDLLAIAYRYFSANGVNKADGTALSAADLAAKAPANLLANLGGGLTSTSDVFAQLDVTASTLIAAIDKLVQAGAKHVLVVEPMTLARTPWGLSFDASAINFLRSLSYDTDESCIKGNTQNSLHCKLTIALSQKYPPTVYGQKVLAVDLAQFFNLISGSTQTGNANTYLSYFSQPPATPACSVVPPIANPLVSVTGYDASSLTNAWTQGCTATAWTDTSYNSFLFADNLNLTPQGNNLLASTIYNSNMFRAAWR